MFALFALCSSRKYITYPREVLPEANSETGYVNCDALNVRSGPSTSSSRLGLIYQGTYVTITGSTGSWYSINYNGRTGYVYAEYITKTSSGGGGSWPPSNPIRQSNSAFNSNIRRWGCAFMSCCWCGKVNSVSGCNAKYNQAINIGGMRADCYILSWDRMKTIAGAKTFRPGGKGESPRSNEKEILQCQNSKTSMHFIVGNGRGGVEYDPAAAGWTAYNDHVSKRFYGY